MCIKNCQTGLFTQEKYEKLKRNRTKLRKSHSVYAYGSERHAVPRTLQELFPTQAGWIMVLRDTTGGYLPWADCFCPPVFPDEDLTYEALAQDFRDCVDASLDDFLLLDEFDALFQGKGNNLTSDNPSKYLLYQDALLGMFDYHIQNVDTNTYYSALAQKLENALSSAGTYKICPIFVMHLHWYWQTKLILESV